MLIFFDTEFTDLGVDPGLVSIGLAFPLATAPQRARPFMRLCGLYIDVWFDGRCRNTTQHVLIESRNEHGKHRFDVQKDESLVAQKCRFLRSIEDVVMDSVTTEIDFHIHRGTENKPTFFYRHPQLR